MRIYYPSSFPGLLFLGFALVAVPLIAALINNAISIDRIVNRSQLAVYQAVTATQNSRRLAELLTAMERSARQMLILGDRSLLEAYVLNRRQFQEVTEAFTVPPFDSDQMTALAEIVAGEASIFAVLSYAQSKVGDLQQATRKFGDLGERTRMITLHSNAMIDREIRAMRATAAKAQQITFWQMLALLPIVVFLAIGFAILIARPIRQIDAAIRDLGSGQHSKPISIAGPGDLQYLGERLEWMRCKLLEVEEQKGRFLQQVSHDLKTPLTALREGAELLSDEVVGKLSPGQREVTDILHHQSLKLQKLIEDLLSYSASQFHGEALVMSMVNMRYLIQRVADDQKLALHARSLKLDIVAEEVSAMGDFNKLRAMLDNLLSNAIKFSPAGGTIVIGAKRCGAQVHLSVADHGPGISPEDRTHIFEPLYQGKTMATGLVKGSGIGLSIVKDFAQAHGGSVEIVDTAPTTGTQFRVRLPLLQAEGQAA
jgi:two-component system sensor histidine kinase GlrK